MVTCVAVKVTVKVTVKVKVTVDKGRPKFPRNKNLKQQWFIKRKRRNIQPIQQVRMCHAYYFR